MFARPLACALVLLAVPGRALAQEAGALPDFGVSERETQFGGVVAPVALPSGGAAAYGYVGAPEVGGGYRQGLSGLEIEGRAAFNYLMLSLAAEGLVRIPVYREGAVAVAPTVGLGLVYDTGSRYYDRSNFQFFGVRPRVGVLATYRVAETVQAIGALDVPWSIPLGAGGGGHLTPLAGGGAEIFLGDEISALVMGQLGLDAIKEPLGVTQYRVGWQVKLGVGFRLF